ncbi:hypothetical protein BH18THE2_BH18THE2_10910 [soil metagenome]
MLVGLNFEGIVLQLGGSGTSSAMDSSLNEEPADYCYLYIPVRLHDFLRKPLDQPQKMIR